MQTFTTLNHAVFVENQLTKAPSPNRPENLLKI